MTGDILDTIDNALRDWSTSEDAMRWTPDAEAVASEAAGAAQTLPLPPRCIYDTSPRMITETTLELFRYRQMWHMPEQGETISINWGEASGLYRVCSVEPAGEQRYTLRLAKLDSPA